MVRSTISPVGVRFGLALSACPLLRSLVGISGGRFTCSAGAFTAVTFLPDHLVRSIELRRSIAWGRPFPALASGSTIRTFVLPIYDSTSVLVFLGSASRLRPPRFLGAFCLTIFIILSVYEDRLLSHLPVCIVSCDYLAQDLAHDFTLYYRALVRVSGSCLSGYPKVLS